MLIFVTGAAGFIGRAVTAEVISAGHQVLGLVRSDASAQIVTSLGGRTLPGDIEDLEILRQGASEADGVIHLAFTNDFSNFPRACEIDRDAIQAMAEAMKGTGKGLVITTGTLLLPKGRVGTEDTEPETEGMIAVRGLAEGLVKKLSKEVGIRGSAVRLAPTVHDVGDKGFIAMLAEIAKKNGFVSYMGEDAYWPAIHRRDAAVLYRLAVEKGSAGGIYHGLGEEGVAVKDTMIAISKKIGLPSKSIGEDEASEKLGFFAHIVNVDNRTSNAKTRQELRWEPKEQGLLADIEENYFKV